MNTYRLVYYENGFAFGGEYIQAPNRQAAQTWAEMCAIARAEDGESRVCATVLCLGEDVTFQGFEVPDDADM